MMEGESSVTRKESNMREPGEASPRNSYSDELYGLSAERASAQATQMGHTPPSESSSAEITCKYEEERIEIKEEEKKGQAFGKAAVAAIVFFLAFAGTAVFLGFALKENHSWREKYEPLHREYDMLKAKNEDLGFALKENHSWKEKYEPLQREYDLLKAKNEDLGAKNEDLGSALKENHSWKEKYEPLQREYDLFKAKNEDLQKKYDLLKTSFEGLKNEYAPVKAIKELLEKQNIELKAELAETRKVEEESITQLQSTVLTQQAKINLLEANKIDLEAQIEKLKKTSVTFPVASKASKYFSLEYKRLLRVHWELRD